MKVKAGTYPQYSLSVIFIIIFLVCSLQHQGQDKYSTEITDEAELQTIALRKAIEESVQKNDYKKAIALQHELLTFKDSVAIQRRTDEITRLQSNFEARLKENRLAIATALQESQISQMENQELQQFIYISGGAVLMIVVLGLLSRLTYMRKSQQEQKEKGLIVAREKLRAEDSEKIREQFLAKMSHEIRTPMNAVMGMTKILKKNKHYEVQEKYLDAIWQSSENLLVILNDILDLSSLEAGKVEIDAIPFKPFNELMKLRDILKFRAEEKGVQLSCELSPDIPEVLIGDPIRLNQILINLTGNAIKFTEEGSVFVKIGLVEKSKSSAVIEGTIVDTGIGIPEDRLEKIFESFTQAESNTTRKYGGTGLGLTISKELVQLQNGHISVTSETNIGSTFKFSIPYQIGDPTDVVESGKQIESLPLNALKVLLVENNTFNIVVAEDELNEIIDNPVIDLASNGLEALNMVIENDYDVVLMDIEMEEMNGYESTAEIRKLDPPKNNVPIIAITANAMLQEIQKSFDAGMDDHLAKPFDPLDLKFKIQRLLFKKNS